MASGTVGYTDTRGNKDYLGIVAQQVGRRLKEASNMARSERAYAESVAEKNNTSLDEAGIGRGHFFGRALGSRFGGDRIARTRGRLSKNPGLGRDPTKNYKQRFRGGFDYSYKQDIAEAAAATGGAIVPAMRGVQIGIDSVGSAVVNVGSALDGLAKTQQDLAKATMFNGMILQVMVRELQQSRSRLSAAREERSLEAGTRKLLGPGGGGGGIKGLLPGAGGTGGRTSYAGGGNILDVVNTLAGQSGNIAKTAGRAGGAGSARLVESALKSGKLTAPSFSLANKAANTMLPGVGSAGRIISKRFAGTSTVANDIAKASSIKPFKKTAPKSTGIIQHFDDVKNKLGPGLRTPDQYYVKMLQDAQTSYFSKPGATMSGFAKEIKKVKDPRLDTLVNAILPELGSEVATLAKATGNTAEEVITNPLAVGALEASAKRGGMIGRILGKGALKSAIKKIPVIAGVAGVLFGIQRALEGDFFGAALEISSGIMGATGVGAGASLGIDAYLLARDFGAPVPLARGGLLTGRAPVNTIMGEAGPEIVTPLNDETFIKFGEGILDAQNRNKSKFINLQSAALEKGFDRFADKRNWFQKLFRLGEKPTKPPFVDIDDDGLDDYTGKPEEPTELQKFGNFLLNKGNQAVQGVQSGLNWIGNLFTPKANANTESNTPMLPGPPPPLPVKTGNKGNFNVYELAFLEMTRQLEGTSGKNSLSTWFGDYGGKTKYGDLTGKTLQEVYDLQTKFLQDPQSQFTDLKGRTLRSAAVGMGQFINPLEQVRAMYAAQGREFDPNKIMFNEQTQMELILDLAKRKRGIDVSKPLTLGGLDILQNEWASFGPGHGQTNRTTGQSLELYNKILRKMMGDMGDTSSLTPTGVDQKVASILNTSMNSSPESGITNIITNNYYAGAGGSDQQADTVFGSDFANLGLEYANINYSLASKA